MGLFSRDKDRIKIQTTTKDSFSGWLKCTHCNELIHTNELQKNIHCCPKCDYHYRLSARARIDLLTDDDSFNEMFSDITPVDSLDFVDSQAYTDRMEKAEKDSGNNEAVITGTCTMNERAVAIAVMDFNFMAGSMGSVVGERITRLIEHAVDEGLPLIIASASGGARMQESILSLMQMAKTSAALSRLAEAKLPFISLLTNPTSGGVTASYASLGDIIIAEPGALVCFAGPRVIEQVIGEKLPPGAQKAEFLLKHGMIDSIIARRDLRDAIIDFIDFMMDNDRDYLEGLKELNGKSKAGRLPQKLQELLDSVEDSDEEEAAPDSKKASVKSKNKKSKSK